MPSGRPAGCFAIALVDLGAKYLLRVTLMYKPKDLNRDWSPRFSTLRDTNWLDSSQNGLKFEPRRVETVFAIF
jgi:hypothetical protein